MATSLARFDPFADLAAIRDQLFAEMSSSRARHAAPVTDIYTEDDSKLTVEAHLPGFAEQDVDVDLDGGALVIRAQREEREPHGALGREPLEAIENGWEDGERERDREVREH